MNLTVFIQWAEMESPGGGGGAVLLDLLCQNGVIGFNTAGIIPAKTIVPQCPWLYFLLFIRRPAGHNMRLDDDNDCIACIASALESIQLSAGYTQIPKSHRGAGKIFCSAMPEAGSGKIVLSHRKPDSD